MTNMSLSVSSPPLMNLGENVHPDKQSLEVNCFLRRAAVQQSCVVKDFACRPFLVQSNLLACILSG